jgi:pimeloyl-ACP methyl ester carboxylesterase
MKVAAGMEYEERGYGPAVVLVHAGVFSTWFAQLFASAALDGFRVVRPIRPGYGKLQRPADHYGLADHATRCATQLAEIGIPRACWVGHSSSCSILLQLALDHPGLVGGLILFETARPSGPLQRTYAPHFIGPALAAASRGDIAGAFDVFLRGVGGAGYRKVLDARLGAGATADAVRESAYFFTDELPAVGQWVFGPQQAAMVDAPALIMTGTTSQPWFAENGDLLARMLPNARQVTLYGADHFGPLTHADDMARITSDFIRIRSRPEAGNRHESR